MRMRVGVPTSSWKSCKTSLTRRSSLSMAFAALAALLAFGPVSVHADGPGPGGAVQQAATAPLSQPVRGAVSAGLSPLPVAQLPLQAPDASGGAATDPVVQALDQPQATSPQAQPAP